MEEIIHQFGKTRVWLDELPAFSAPVSSWRKEEFSCDTRRSLNLHRAAIEVVRHRLPSSYGLLGGELLPSEAGTLLVKVAITLDRVPVSGTLADGTDALFAGIPEIEGYGQAIIEGVAGHPERALLGGGTLHFEWAAHGNARSSQRVFTWLGWGIVQLLLHAHPPASPEALTMLLRNAKTGKWGI